MNLILEIAFTHVRARLRQTVVAVFGVATGVGFSVMMAGLMEGSQTDFMKRLVDTIPHIAISDERNEATVQPAQLKFDAVEIHGLSPQVRRRGIKNPKALIADLGTWLPGTLTPSVKTSGLIRFAGRDVSVSLNGIEPHSEALVSKLEEYMRSGTLSSLYAATNGIILGNRLAEKIGARVGSNITIVSTGGVRLTAHVVGIFHTGGRMIDESSAYVLLKTAQILENQTGIVNEIRVHLAEPLRSREIASRIAIETSYKAVSWEEANEDLLSSFRIRDILMYTVVGAILLVASFGTYNIISTITHEKARDIAIMKSLGFRERSVRTIFVVEALAIGTLGALLGFLTGYLLSLAVASIEIKSPFVDTTHMPMTYAWRHYAIAGGVAILSSLVAGYWPARKAAKVHPVEIIRGAT